MDTKFLARYEDVPEKGSIIVEDKNGTKIVLFKLEGKIYALDNRCPHQEAPLGEGDIIDGFVICPRHYWEFDIRTGKCLTEPDYRAKQIEVIVEKGNIFLA